MPSIPAPAETSVLPGARVVRSDRGGGVVQDRRTRTAEWPLWKQARPCRPSRSCARLPRSITEVAGCVLPPRAARGVRHPCVTSGGLTVRAAQPAAGSGVTTLGASEGGAIAIMSSCLHGNMQGLWVAGMTTSEAEMVSLTVRVPADLRKRLRVHAAEHGMSVQDCAQSALVTWLDQRESGEKQS